MFHGDFNHIPKYYMGRSPLSSFTRYEKDIQSNLALLGMIAVVVPWTWPVIKRLVKIKHTKLINKLYTILYQTVKAFMIRKIYPTDIPWLQYIPILWESFKQEFLKHEIDVV